MRALILVDIQNDFLPGGALAVPQGDEVIAVANEEVEQGYDVIVATQDWHPADHQSFASQHAGHAVGEQIELHGLSQVLWPDHCVEGSAGAEFAAALDLSKVDEVFRKGTDRDIDSYSGFFDNGHRKETGMGEFLQQRGVDAVTIVGLATDYCVKFTALDAVELGFDTRLLLRGCRGVELSEGDVAAAIEEMELAGVEVVNGSGGATATE